MSDLAEPGTVWVCGACGKRARHRVEGGIDAGWDTSCFTWAVLCWEASIELDEHGHLVNADAAIEDLRTYSEEEVARARAEPCAHIFVNGVTRICQACGAGVPA